MSKTNIELYYEDDLVQLYWGSAMSGLKPWLGGDVLMTDPPYGTANMTGKGRGGYGRKGFHIEGDNDTQIRDMVLHVWYNSVQAGAIWGDGDIDTSPRPALVFGSPRLPDPPGPWTDRLVWMKKRPGMNGGPWRYTHESIYAFGFVRVDDAHTSVITKFPLAEGNEHLHAKPVGLLEYLMECAPPGVIADPFCGSGSTLLAAKRMGRKAIGVELEEKFCELTAKRLQEAQPVLAMETW